jgi:hypothetical protein
VEQRSDRSTPLLVAGMPRTGSTWVAKILSFAPGVVWISEPDNDWPDPFGLKAKITLGRFPILAADEQAPPEYELLWERAFGGFRQSGLLFALADRLETWDKTKRDLWRATCDHANPRVAPWLRLFASLAKPPSKREEGQIVMVKSVHAPLALEWVTSRFQPRVLLVMRHPLNVIASWMEFGWGGHYLDTHPKIRDRFAAPWGLPQLPADRSPLAAVTWEVALFTTVLHAAAETHKDWSVVSHETLCTDPVTGFRELFSRFDLVWGEKAERVLTESDRPGTGYVVRRVAAEQPDRWKQRLTRQQIQEIWSLLSQIEAPWVEHVARDVA